MLYNSFFAYSGRSREPRTGVENGFCCGPFRDRSVIGSRTGGTATGLLN